MTNIKKWIGAIALGGLITSSAHALQIADCYVIDFTAGGNPADSCGVGATANDSLADVNAQFGPGWSTGANVTVTPSASGTGFDWSIPSIPFLDALFAVKQSSPSSAANPGGWIAYLFTPLKNKSGSFSTTASFGVNDYSHVNMYTRGSKQVPEISAAGMPLALGLIVSLIMWRRDRRKSS
jgi:hypothetical protein